MDLDVEPQTLSTFRSKTLVSRGPHTWNMSNVSPNRRFSFSHPPRRPRVKFILVPALLPHHLVGPAAERSRRLLSRLETDAIRKKDTLGVDRRLRVPRRLFR